MENCSLRLLSLCSSSHLFVNISLCFSHLILSYSILTLFGIFFSVLKPCQYLWQSGFFVVAVVIFLMENIKYTHKVNNGIKPHITITQFQQLLTFLSCGIYTPTHSQLPPTLLVVIVHKNFLQVFIQAKCTYFETHRSQL